MIKTKFEISAGGIVYKKLKRQKAKGKTNLAKYKIEYLICQHSFHKGWVFPKGLVDKGESVEQAAIREVKEEGGVDAKIIKKLPKTYGYFYQYHGEKIKKTVHYFLMEYISGDPADHDWEMLEAKFIPEKEIIKTLTYPSEKKAFQDAILIVSNQVIK